VRENKGFQTVLDAAILKKKARRPIRWDGGRDSQTDLTELMSHHAKAWFFVGG
jgi:hypothetical protein